MFRYFKNNLICIIFIHIVCLLPLWIYLSMEVYFWSEALRIMLFTYSVVFLPGFLFSFIFFPKHLPILRPVSDTNIEETEKGGLDWVERVGISFALSLTAIPLLVYIANRIGMPINVFFISLVVFGFSGICGLYLIYRIFKQKKISL